MIRASNTGSTKSVLAHYKYLIITSLNREISVTRNIFCGLGTESLTLRQMVNTKTVTI
jgi:hypothetical protein